MAPLSNSTSVVAVSDDSDQIVTGQAAFWALMALALNAMAQSSITTDIFFGTEDLFKGGLTLHMSSPIICLFDVLIELILTIICLWRRLCRVLPWRQESNSAPVRRDGSRSELSTQEYLGVRVILFLFAVLPQVIKVFSMRGVPALQAVVAVYLAAPLMRTITNVLGVESHHLKREFKDSIDQEIVPVLLVVVLTGFHLVAFMALWDPIFHLLAGHEGPPLVRTLRVLDWLLYSAFLLSLAACAIWVLVPLFLSPALVREKWPHKSPIKYSLIARLLSLGVRSIKDKSYSLEFSSRIGNLLFRALRTTEPLMMVLMLACLVESAVYRSPKLIRSHSDGSDRHDTPADDAHHAPDPTPTESGVPDSTAQQPGHAPGPVALQETTDTTETASPDSVVAISTADSGDDPYTHNTVDDAGMAPKEDGCTDSVAQQSERASESASTQETIDMAQAALPNNVGAKSTADSGDGVCTNDTVDDADTVPKADVRTDSVAQQSGSMSESASTQETANSAPAASSTGSKRVFKPGNDLSHFLAALKGLEDIEIILEANDRLTPVTLTVSELSADTLETIRTRLPRIHWWQLEDNPIDQMITCATVTMSIYDGALAATVGARTAGTHEVSAASTSDSTSDEPVSSSSQDPHEIDTFPLWNLIAAQIITLRNLIPAALLHAWKNGAKGPRTSKHDRIRRFSRTLAIAIALLASHLFWWCVISGIAIFIHGTSVFDTFVSSRHPRKQRVWNTVAILNLVTAVTYFFFAYDGADTVNPPWTSFLG